MSHHDSHATTEDDAAIARLLAQDMSIESEHHPHHYDMATPSSTFESDTAMAQRLSMEQQNDQGTFDSDAALARRLAVEGGDDSSSAAVARGYGGGGAGDGGVLGGIIPPFPGHRRANPPSRPTTNRSSSPSPQSAAPSSSPFAPRSSPYNQSDPPSSSVPDNHMCVVPCIMGDGACVEMMVDTGAQSSVISYSLAKELKLDNRIDRRCRGVAAGVGRAAILGRIRHVTCTMGNVEFDMDFMVLDVPDKMLLLGLDLMRKFKCVVDLERQRLIFGGIDGVDVPFLPPEEQHIPAMMMNGNGCPTM